MNLMMLVIPDSAMTNAERQRRFRQRHPGYYKRRKPRPLPLTQSQAAFFPPAAIQPTVTPAETPATHEENLSISSMAA